MEPGNKSDSHNDPDGVVCDGEGSTFNDTISPTDVDASGVPFSKSGTESAVQEHDGNEPMESKSSRSSPSLPLGTDAYTFWMSNTLQQQSFRNESSILQANEIRSTGNQGIHSLSYNPSGTEFSKRQNVPRQVQCIRIPRHTYVPRPPIFQARNNTPNIDRQLRAEGQTFSDNIYHEIQETQFRTKLSELNVNRDSRPSGQQFAESDMNRAQGPDFISHRSGNEFIMPRAVPGNEFRKVQITHIQSYSQLSAGSRRNQDSTLQSFQQSGGRANCIRSSHLQGVQQSQGIPNYTQGSYLQVLQLSVRHPGRVINSSEVDSTTKARYCPRMLIPKESITNQDLRSTTRKPIGRGRHQTFIDHLPNKRNLQLYSQPPQQSMIRSQPAESGPSTGQAPDPLPDKFVGQRFVDKKELAFDQNKLPIIRTEHANVSMLQNLDPHPYEMLNIVVCGHPNLTRRLLQTLSVGLPVHFASPFSIVSKRNVMRCGVMFAVSIWQVDNLSQSEPLFKWCASSKTTIMFAVDGLEQPLQLMIGLVQSHVGIRVPIIVVLCRLSIISASNDPWNNHARMIRLRFLRCGYMLKAKLNISAFLECNINFKEDVDAAFSTAIDVSRLFQMST